jgi:hypothetical protein
MRDCLELLTDMLGLFQGKGFSPTTWVPCPLGCCRMLQLQQFISLGVLVLALSANNVAGRAFGIGEEEDVFAQPHTAIDLNSTNFDHYLSPLPPQQWCLIEFYAAWCPHCRSVSCGFGWIRTWTC